MHPPSRTERRAARSRAGGVRGAGIAFVMLVAGLALAGPGDGWNEVRTEHFVVVGDASPERSVEVATGLERLRGAIAAYTGLREDRRDRPLVVYLFDRFRTSRGVLPDGALEDRPGSLYYRCPDADFIVVHAVRGVDAASLAYHEYVHYVVERTVPAAPLWLSEGLAEFFGTFQGTSLEGEIGRLPLRNVGILERGARLPVERVLRATPDSDTYRAIATKSLFHAQAWELVHRRLTHAREAALADLARLASAGRGSDASRVAAATSVAWARQVAELPPARRARHVRVPLPRIVPRDAEVTAIAPAEAYARLGDLALHHDPERAIRLYERALEIDARCAAAHAGRGRWLALRGDRAAAIESLRRAVEIEGTDRRHRRLLERLEAIEAAATTAR